MKISKVALVAALILHVQVYSQVCDSSSEPKTLIPTITSKAGTATLVGFSEFSSPSSPPRKYLRKELSGGWEAELWKPDGSARIPGPVVIDSSPAISSTFAQSYGGLPTGWYDQTGTASGVHHILIHSGDNGISVDYAFNRNWPSYGGLAFEKDGQIVGGWSRRDRPNSPGIYTVYAYVTFAGNFPGPADPGWYGASGVGTVEWREVGAIAKVSYSGAIVFDPLTNTTTSTARATGIFNRTPIDQAISSATQNSFNAAGCSFTVATTATTQSNGMTGSLCPTSTSGISQKVVSADPTDTLTDEDTEDAALVRELARVSVSSVPLAYRTKRTTGFSFGFSEMSVEVPLEITCAGRYRVIFHLRKKPHGSSAVGEPLQVYVEREFQAGFQTLRGRTDLNAMMLDFEGATLPMDYDTDYRLEKVELSQSCESAEPGAVEVRRGSVRVTMSLGRSAAGLGAGEIKLVADSITPVLYTPAALQLALVAGAPVEALAAPDGTIRQIRAPAALADIETLTESSFHVRFFALAEVGEADPETGIYALGGTPFVTVTFENPEPANSSSGWFRITESRGSITRVSEFHHDASAGEWTLVSGNGLRRESARIQTVAGGRIETITIRNEDGSIASVTLREIRTFPWGEETTREVLDPDGAALETVTEFYSTPGEPGFGKLKQRYSSDGSWAQFAYDAFGRPTKEIRPFLNSMPDEPEAAHRVTFTTYGSLPDSDGDGTEEELVTVVQQTLGQETARTYRLSWSKPVVLTDGSFTRRSDIRCVVPAADWNAPGNLVTETLSYTAAPFAGRSRRVVNPDGTGSISSYALAPDGRQSAVLSTGAFDGSFSSIIDGTRSTTFTDGAGRVVASVTVDIASGLTVDEWTATAFDTLGRPTRLDYGDGTFVLRDYACCGLLSETDRTGAVTTNDYDDLGRLRGQTRHGITRITGLDAEGRMTSVARVGTDGSRMLLEETDYDHAGRMVEQRDALGRATQFHVSTDTSTGQTTRTTLLPGGGTRVETTARDGSLLSVGGSAAPTKRYQHAITNHQRVLREISIGDGSEETEWVETYTDFAGRYCRTLYADRVAAEAFYNEVGQLVRQTDADGVTQLFAYDAQGRQEVTAVDIDRNGVIDYAGSDRITRTRTSVASKSTDAGPVTVQQTITEVWGEEGVDAPMVESVSEQSTDGRHFWRSHHGLVTESSTIFTGGGDATTTARTPDGTLSTQVSTSGNVASATRTHPDLGTLSSATYGYDAHGRLETMSDARNGTTSYTYFADDQLETVTTPDPDPTRTGDGYDPQVTRFGYDAQGRQNLVTHPDDTEVHTLYYPDGQVQRTWGSRTYPVEYTYDSQGRLKTLTTWQDFASDSGKATTTWVYDPQRGWLNDKLYADGTGPSYGYTAAGRMQSRTWARGAVTNYRYSSAGELLEVDYADDTPDVRVSYDRLGRSRQIADASGIRTLTYTHEGQLEREHYSSGALADISVERQFDSLERTEGISVAMGADYVYAVGYTFDSASRLKTVSRGTNTATYRYGEGTSRGEGVTFTAGGVARLTTEKSYDRLNRLASVTNHPASGSAANFAYTYNNANQRSRVMREDLSRWDYGYDALGQVTSATKAFGTGVPALGFGFSYSYDDIGNRRSSANNGAISEYSANLLNQYEHRSVPGLVEVRGHAEADAIVSVKADDGLPQRATRQGDAFYLPVPVDNQSAAVATRIKVTGVRNNAGPNGEDSVAEIERVAFTPEDPESFGHDADGNLLADARWTYAWDGENRLSAMETSPAARAAGIAAQRYEFAYDAQGRRFAKKVYEWANGDWVLARHTKFVYEHWNLLAEFDAMNTHAVTRSYVWGLDLSGTMQGAGGVGGLLFTTLPATASSPPTTHAHAYDGNGNVVLLVDQSTGTPSATYEYSAFGKILTATGPAAEENPFRFSTKIIVEAELLYYGYRYYKPCTGSWLNRDPLREHGGANLYGFVGNDALSSIDILGLFKPTYHRSITVNGLANTGFSRSAIEVIAAANVDQDDGAVVGILGSRAHPFFDPVNHGDDNRIDETIDRIAQRLQNAASTECRDCDQVREMLREIGRALHAVQDLYAHSTFVETSGRDASNPAETPLWELFLPSGAPNVPNGVVTGIYRYPRDNAPGLSHLQVNKDDPGSLRGSQRNPRGVLLFEQAQSAATRHTERIGRDIMGRLMPAQRARLEACFR